MEADMKVTRDVVSDLWPLYEAGEASADTRALVDAFLAEEPAFADTLKRGLSLPATEVPMAMSQSIETAALARTRDLVHGRGWLRGVKLFALVMTAFALTRLLQEVSWTGSPARFVAEAAMAAIAWSVYTAVLMHQRRKALRA
jgi:hypothetical protein